MNIEVLALCQMYSDLKDQRCAQLADEETAPHDGSSPVGCSQEVVGPGLEPRELNPEFSSSLKLSKKSVGVEGEDSMW